MQKQTTLSTLLLAFAAFIPALRPLTKFLPHPELVLPAAFAAILAGIYLLIRNPRNTKHETLNTILASPWPSCLLIAVLAVAIATVYPHADALKLHMLGSDADDAMVIAGTALSHGLNPYQFTTYFGNPLSPGPGWAALVAPLTRLGLYGLLTPLALAFTVLSLRITNHPWLQTNRVTLALFSCLLLWELTVTGNDLPAFGLLFLSTVLLLTRQRIGRAELIALTILLGSLATARIAFFYLPLLVGCSLVAVWPKRAITVGLGGTLLMAALHGGFYLLSPDFYPPLHLLGRAQSLLTGEALYAALTFLTIVGIQSLYHWRWWTAPRHAAWGLGAPLLVLSLADLTQNAAFARWEGATYLIPALPLVIYTLLRPTFKHN